MTDGKRAREVIAQHKAAKAGAVVVPPRPKPPPPPKPPKPAKPKSAGPPQGKPAWVWDAEMTKRGRLPGEANFNLTFDAVRAEWVGQLRIPTADGGTHVFTGTMSGCFKLLNGLDKQYRAWLASKATAAA
jgi:hypothetical protein